MNQLVLNWPSALQDPDQQIHAIQKAFSDIQDNINSNATQPLVSVFLPSLTMTASANTTGASYSAIPGWSWTINSKGGLVDIDMILAGTMSNSEPGQFALLIDGKIVLEATTISINSGSGTAAAFQLSLRWRAVLGAGQHTILVQYATPSGGSLTVNDRSRGAVSSSASIIEYPNNVQNLNVSAA